MRVDYAEITELPGSRLNAEQLARFVHRYAVCAVLAHGRILEVACGPAIGLSALQSVGKAVTGVCYTPAVLQDAHAYFQDRLPLVTGDAQQLPVETDAFDAVLCLEAIYYFTSPVAFLAEARRVLAPGGMLLIAGSNPDWPHFVPGNLSRHYPSAPELGNWLREAGFNAVILFGAFAWHESSTRHAMAMRLRRLLLRSRFRQVIGPVAERLKRMVHGQLEPLPKELPAHVLQRVAETLSLAPLLSDQPDKVHRVLYAVGHVPAD